MQNQYCKGIDTDVQFADADKLLGGQWIEYRVVFIMEMSDSIGIIYFIKVNSQRRVLFLG